MKPPYVTDAGGDSAAHAQPESLNTFDSFDDDARPLERAVARAAAQWLVRLADNPTAEDIAACSRWRAA
ncbi:DUF4880 domain-containing protein, partial [Paraburkholderia sp. Ac-20347]|uniref:DUF4880 domain-containing protein n=1 Tax=Paraburkholderia sp. Ac-20347 TaxID=2703892 RepID=UPI00197D72A0